MAIRKFTVSDRTRLQKYLHDWLPLRAAKHMHQPAVDTQCPLCRQHKEDLWHFLECQHSCRQTLFSKLQKQIQQLHKRYNIDPHLLQLLWQGLNSVRQQYPIDEHLETYPTEFHPLFHDQRRIGWEQLYYGRIASSWSYYVDHHSQYRTNGTIFYSQVTELIWKYILESWAIRNSALHPAQHSAQILQSLEPQVHQIFENINNDPALRDYAPQASAEEILARPIRSIRQFIQTCYNQMRNHTTSARTRAVHRTQDIRNFFTHRLHKHNLKPP